MNTTIGPPKTATTSIQDTLYLNHKLLKQKYNIDYCPELCRIHGGKQTGHHLIAWQEFNQSHLYYKKVDLTYVTSILNASENILLSSEWLIVGRQEQISLLINHWNLPEKRKIVLFVRDEFQLVRSRWMQSIKMGYDFISFQDFYFKKYKKSRKTISKIVEPWVQAGFVVEILNYDKLIKGDSDLSMELVNRVYNINIESKEWKTVPASNVSPKIAKVNLYRMLIVAISKIPFITLFLGRCVSKPMYNKLHMNICKLLPEIKLLNPDGVLVKQDIQTLPKYDDLNA